MRVNGQDLRSWVGKQDVSTFELDGYAFKNYELFEDKKDFIYDFKQIIKKVESGGQLVYQLRKGLEKITVYFTYVSVGDQKMVVFN